jgi:hypothetical protein
MTTLVVAIRAHSYLVFKAASSGHSIKKFCENTYSYEREAFTVLKSLEQL